jgi:hypothetical protein
VSHGQQKGATSTGAWQGSQRQSFNSAVHDRGGVSLYRTAPFIRRVRIGLHHVVYTRQAAGVGYFIKALACALTKAKLRHDIASSMSTI